ncbi:L-threonylcarbamoyladenylate synthase [Candidatus Latescibacterota bacterium]
MTTVSGTEIHDAVKILKNGGIVVYPTETVYGIGCDPLNRQACERIQLIKRRSENKSFILIADSPECIEKFAGPLDDTAKRLAMAFWPGALTIVIRAQKDLPNHLKGPSEGVAFRVTPNPVASALSSEFGRPVVSTSANITTEQPVESYEDALQMFGGKVDCILKSDGPLRGNPSTVIDITASEPRLLRVGAISEERIREAL